MKKIKLLTPLLGLTMLSSAVIPLASCSQNATEERVVQVSDMFAKTIKLSQEYKDGDLVVTITPVDTKMYVEFLNKIMIGSTTLTVGDDYTFDNTTQQITIKKAALSNGGWITIYPTGLVEKPDTRKISNIKIATEAASTSFFTKEPFSHTGLVVNAIFADGTEEDVTSKCNFSSDTVDLTKDYFEDGDKGTHSVTITYGGKTTSYDITIVEGIEAGYDYKAHGAYSSVPTPKAAGGILTKDFNNIYLEDVSKSSYGYQLFVDDVLSSFNSQYNWATAQGYTINSFTITILNPKITKVTVGNEEEYRISFTIKIDANVGDGSGLTDVILSCNNIKLNPSYESSGEVSPIKFSPYYDISDTNYKGWSIYFKDNNLSEEASISDASNQDEIDEFNDLTINYYGWRLCNVMIIYSTYSKLLNFVYSISVGDMPDGLKLTNLPKTVSASDNKVTCTLNSTMGGSFVPTLHISDTNGTELAACPAPYLCKDGDNEVVFSYYNTLYNYWTNFSTDIVLSVTLNPDVDYIPVEFETNLPAGWKLRADGETSPIDYLRVGGTEDDYWSWYSYLIPTTQETIDNEYSILAQYKTDKTGDAWTVFDYGASQTKAAGATTTSQLYVYGRCGTYRPSYIKIKIDITKN